MNLVLWFVRFAVVCFAGGVVLAAIGMFISWVVLKVTKRAMPAKLALLLTVVASMAWSVLVLSHL